MANLLLHSLTEFPGLVRALTTDLRPAHVLEVGSESGEVSALLAELVATWGGRLTVIDPRPDLRVMELAGRGALELVVGVTPEALLNVAQADLVLVDGDHNYSTVRDELALLFLDGRAPVVLLHDVGWPCARRDQYYDPSRIATSDIQPCSFDHGVVPGHATALLGRGFRGDGQYAIALDEGGPRNGVLTAVEDFLSGRLDLRFRMLDAIFGLGVVFPSDGPTSEIVETVFDAYDSPLLSTLEQNRLQLYCHVVDLQDTLAVREHEIAELQSLVAHRVAAPTTLKGLFRRLAWPVLQYGRQLVKRSCR